MKIRYLLFIFVLFFSSPVWATTRYVSLSGSGPLPCLTGSPCSFATALAATAAGDTIMFKNGIHSVSSLLDINCTSNAANGTAALPISVQSETERGAILDGSSNAAVGVLKISNCAYWNITGIVFKDGLHAAQGLNGVSAVIFDNDNHINFKRNVLAYANRSCNCHLMEVVHNSSFVTIEENEFYYFHRYGLLVYNSSHDNIIKRNYGNPRGWDTVPANGEYCAPGVCHGSLLNLYGGSGSINNNKVLNNIAEDSPIWLYASTANNRYYGNISFGTMNDPTLLLGFVGGTNYCSEVHDSDTWENNLAYSTGGNRASFNPRGQLNFTSRNMTMLNGTISFDDDVCNRNTSVSFVNTAQIGTGSTTGFAENSIDSWSNNYVATYNNATNFYPDNASTTNRVALSSNPFTSCVVFVPAAIKGRGLNGADIGANILYAYNDDLTLSNTPLWITATKKWNPALIGVRVNADGIDTRTNSIADVEMRLHPNCTTWPAGYGSTTNLVVTPPSSPINLVVTK